MGRRGRWLIGAAYAAVSSVGPIAACGFAGNGLASPDGGSPDVTVHDGPAPTGDSAADGARPDAPLADGPAADTAPDTAPSDATSDSSACDCQDPACTQAGWVCVPAVPAGWAYVGYAPAQVSCPPTFGATYPVVTDLAPGSPSCTCPCSPGVPPQCVPAFGLHDCDGGAFNGPYPDDDGGCVYNVQTLMFMNATLAMTDEVTGGTCQAGNPQADFPYTDQPATVCTGAARFGGGCVGQQVCAPTPGQGTSACIWQPGSNVPCPSGWSTPHDVGVLDTSMETCQCGACGVPVADCSGATLSLFSASNCGGSPDLTVNEGVCTMWPANYHAYQLAPGSPLGVACAPATPTIGGGPRLSPEYTVCCAP